MQEVKDCTWDLWYIQMEPGHLCTSPQEVGWKPTRCWTFLFYKEEERGEEEEEEEEDCLPYETIL